MLKPITLPVFPQYGGVMEEAHSWGLQVCRELAASPLVVFRNISRAEDEPTAEFKEEFMVALLRRNPVAFLQRWGEHLSPQQLKDFR